MEVDKKIILKLIKTLEELKGSIKNISELSNETPVEIEEHIPDNKVLKSPIVGTAYLAPEPGGKRFVDVGKTIKKGDTIMIVEAMKTMNHVPSTKDGTIKKICVDDGEPVEFGQKLIILE